VRSYNESLEKEKIDLIKEKNKYAKETYQLRVEVDRRPWSNSEATDTIRKCQDNIQKLYSKLMESQNKYVSRCNEYKKLDIEHSRLQNEYNQVKRIMMGKQSEVEILKEDLNNANQELKKLKEENNNITKNSVILMQDEYNKFTRFQNSLQELINQRSNINKDIGKLREKISQEVVKIKRINNNQDEIEMLQQQIENLKLQNKLQEISLEMAEENSNIAEESTKLLLEVRKLNAEEILKNYNASSTNNQTNLLRESLSSLQSQNRDNQSEDSTQRMEIRPIETNSAHGKCLIILLDYLILFKDFFIYLYFKI
jgi:chromosome segregation ATPase